MNSDKTKSNTPKITAEDVAEALQDTMIVLSPIFEALEALQDTRRTRKTNKKNATRGGAFVYPDTNGDFFYQYEQMTAVHKFDCSGFKDVTLETACKLLAQGLANTLVIESQKAGRALVDDDFEAQYTATDGVKIDVAKTLKSRSSQGLTAENKVKRDFEKLNDVQKRAIVAEQMKVLGITANDL